MNHLIMKAQVPRSHYRTRGTNQRPYFEMLWFGETKVSSAE